MAMPAAPKPRRQSTFSPSVLHANGATITATWMPRK